MADFVQEYLEKIGFTVTQEEVLPGRPNVIARAPVLMSDHAFC